MNILSDLPSIFAELKGLNFTSKKTPEYKKKKGQFFTPGELARFLGNIASDPRKTKITILDPGCGTGILSCALIENLLKFGIREIHLTAYEADKELIPYTKESYQYLKEWLQERNISFHYNLISTDFLEIFGSNSCKLEVCSFDYVIGNPPYFKISKEELKKRSLPSIINGQSNVYSIFMAISAELLNENGEMIFLIPRSFASGGYFTKFRHCFFKKIHLTRVHLFNSRKAVFKRDKILQEIIALQGSRNRSENLKISVSNDVSDIEKSIVKEYSRKDIIDFDSEMKILHLPSNNYEEKTLRLFKNWKNHLMDYDIQVSTGPVVFFRAKEFLHWEDNIEEASLTPLIWLQNITKMKVSWPILNMERPQYIRFGQKTQKILIQNRNLVLLRRFSSKDDKRRLIAAPYLSKSNNNKYLGIENRLNYIYRSSGEFSEEEVYGLAAVLNSKIYETFFRTMNGNVNVSASEIRYLTFPPLEVIREIGLEILNNRNNLTSDEIEKLIDGQLQQNLELV